MFNLFQLPLEIIDLVLSNFSLDELTTLFNLENLSTEDDVRYLVIKHMALSQCYKNRNIVFSNRATNNLVCLTEDRLEYLIKKNIIIKPKKFKLILNQHLKREWIDYFRNFEEVHIVLTKFKNCCQFCGLYSDLIFNLNDTNFLNKSSIQSLLIHLFDYDNIKNTTRRFDSLTYLNLSYNRLENLDHFQLPLTLKSLNLSNNNFWRLDSQLNNLIELKTLDLSNNNLLSLSINLPNLVSLSLLGNNLMNNKFIQRLTNLETLDLSRNLISTLFPFPPNIKFINLSNNHLGNDFDYTVFPPFLLQLNLSWCRLSDETKSKLPFINFIS